LLAAGFIELDDKIWLIGLKIRRRIIKGKVGIFTNSDKRQIRWAGTQLASYTLDHFPGIALPVEQVVVRDGGLVNQPLEEIFAKTGAMSGRESNVLVQVEHFDALPFDPWGSGKSLQELEL
jgi:hypothetical protein